MIDLPVVEGVAFRLIDGFSAYAVGDDGSVWSKYMASGRGGYAVSWRRLSLYRRPYGARYVVVCLRLNEGKGRVTCRYIHRLVLEAFVGPCPEGMECLHGDNDTANNRQTNLRWGTPVENTADKFRHGTFVVGSNHANAKLTDDAVREIRRLYAAGYLQRELGDRYGVNQSIISGVVRRKGWAHVA